MITELLPGTPLGNLVRGSQALLNSKFPNEFEVYMCSLELVSAKTGKTLVYFVFPVMPNSIDSSKSTLTNVFNTLGGVTVLSTTTFIPFDVNLSGSFGKSFKVSLGNTYQDISSSLSGSGTVFEKFKGLIDSFSNRVKTGYGYCKLLESILEESKKLDENGQRVLYFYNLAFNQKLVVEPMNINFKQDLSTNTVWNYNLNLKAVADTQLVKTVHQGSRGEDLTSSLSKERMISQVASTVFSTISNLLK